MRTTLTLTGVALLTGVACFGADHQRDTAKRSPAATVQPDAEPDTKVGAQDGIPETDSDSETEAEDTAPGTTEVFSEENTVGLPFTEEQLIDERAIRETDDSFVKAYEAGDAAGVAAHFTENAEYVDESGNVFQGRPAIAESLREYFAENPVRSLQLNIETIRFISPGVAVEDGHTTLTLPENPASVESDYTTLYVKTEGKWLAASVRDHAPRDRREHRAQLQQLAWLQGDWVDEGDDAIVTFSCEAVDNGNFLLRKFTILVAGQEAVSGTQRIGWDPLTGKLRAWIFDSEGSYGEGLWHRDGENWVLKCTGVLAGGQATSGTSIYASINDHTMTWQSVDHEIAGI